MSRSSRRRSRQARLKKHPRKTVYPKPEYYKILKQAYPVAVDPNKGLFTYEGKLSERHSETGDGWAPFGYVCPECGTSSRSHWLWWVTRDRVMCSNCVKHTLEFQDWKEHLEKG